MIDWHVTFGSNLISIFIVVLQIFSNDKEEMKYYAVGNGRRTGLFLSWRACEKQVKGYPGAVFKSFISPREAEAFLSAKSPSAHADPSSSTTKPGDDKSTSVLRLDSPDRAVDESLYDVIYCDGVRNKNGQAGIGVWWGENDPRNIAERCPGDQTKYRAELIAIARVLETAPREGKPLLIRTDSQYSIKCLDNWLPKWEKNDFRTAKREPVKNKDLIRYVAGLRNSRRQDVRLDHCSRDLGNREAEVQAQLGAQLPEIPEKDWPPRDRDIVR